MKLMKKEFNGTLFLVVGNSGSGKDSIIRGIVENFPPNIKMILNPKRYITRIPSDTEKNLYVSPEKFREMSNKGDFALEWHIYGLDYGIPIIIEKWLDSGHPVIINVSRTVIREARAKYKNLKVIFIQVPIEISIHRLKDRKRELGDLLKQRIERARTHQTYNTADIIIDNSGALDDAIKFVMNYILKILKKKSKIE